MSCLVSLSACAYPLCKLNVCVSSVFLVDWLDFTNLVKGCGRMWLVALPLLFVAKCWLVWIIASLSSGFVMLSAGMHYQLNRCLSPDWDLLCPQKLLHHLFTLYSSKSLCGCSWLCVGLNKGGQPEGFSFQLSLNLDQGPWCTMLLQLKPQWSLRIALFILSREC